MPSPAPDPLTSRPLSVWLVDPFEDIPGEGTPPLRTWSLARVLAGRGHDCIWWTSTWSQRRKALRTAPLGIREDEGFSVRLVATRPYAKDASLARRASQRDFGGTFERLANEGVSSGQLERPDIIIASLPTLEAAEASQRLARKLDATLILDVRDAWPAMAERLVPGPRFLRPLIAPLVLGDIDGRRRSLVATVDALSATSTAFGIAFVGDTRETPSHVCRVGVYVDEFGVGPRTLVAVPGPGDAADSALASPPLECVCAANVEDETGVESIPNVARQLASRGLPVSIHVLCGGSPPTALRRAAELLTGTCRLQIHGPLERGDFIALLARCQAAIVCDRPGNTLDVPDKACEYAAAGLAIIHATPGDVQEMVIRHDAGVACPAGDTAAIVQAIVGLAGDRRRLATMRQAARQMAEREFDREKTYADFVDWIETIQGGG